MVEAVIEAMMESRARRRAYRQWAALLVGACMATALTACGDLEVRDSNPAIAAMSNCEKISALTDAHDKGFEKIRYAKSNTEIMDIWRARYHLVGDSCQVWDWGTGNTDYVCTLVAPNEALARERFQRAIDITRGCLDASWQLAVTKRKLGNGSKASFSRRGDDTIVATHVVETPGIFRSEWTTYYFVGDPNDQL